MKKRWLAMAMVLVFTLATAATVLAATTGDASQPAAAVKAGQQAAHTVKQEVKKIVRIDKKLKIQIRKENLRIKNLLKKARKNGQTDKIQNAKTINEQAAPIRTAVKDLRKDRQDAVAQLRQDKTNGDKDAVAADIQKIADIQKQIDQKLNELIQVKLDVIKALS